MTHLSTLKLHQYRYGELDGDLCEEVRNHIATCERCAARLNVQERAREDFVLQPVPEAITSATPANNSRWFRRLAPILVAAAAILFVSMFWAAPDDGMRPKGDLPEIEVQIATDAGPRAIRDGDRLGEGDRVQLLYDPRGATLVTFVGRDGSGEIEVYKSITPRGTGLQPAPFALTLDDAPGPQEFWVIASDRSLDGEEIADAIDGGLNDVQVRSVILPKE